MYVRYSFLDWTFIVAVLGGVVGAVGCAHASPSSLSDAPGGLNASGPKSVEPTPSSSQFPTHTEAAGFTGKPAEPSPHSRNAEPPSAAVMAPPPAAQSQRDALQPRDAVASLPAATASEPVPPEPPMPLGPDGPRYRVTGVADSDVLFLRASPGPQGRAIGQIPAHAAGLAGTGGEKSVGAGLWREVVYDGLQGWVNARFLAEERP